MKQNALLYLYGKDGRINYYNLGNIERIIYSFRISFSYEIPYSKGYVSRTLIYQESQFYVELSLTDLAILIKSYKESYMPEHNLFINTSLSKKLTDG